MYMRLHVKYLLFLSDFNETWILSTDFRKILKFHENLSSGSRVVPCGQMDEQMERHDKVNACFLHFYDCALKLCNLVTVLCVLSATKNCSYVEFLK
jgi:hypothetical protein